MNPATERKLNTIYDLLEAREFKKALKLTQTCIQKQNHSVFFAAEALIYQRMGKIAEALDKAQELRNRKLEDRATIEILTLIYRSLGRARDVAEMYELQYEQQPVLETAEALFSAYATDFDVDKQFSLAMKLMKSWPEPKYTLWAVLSLVLSVEMGRSKAASLGLAEQLIGKLGAKQDFVDTEQTVRVLLAVYRIGAKHEKTLALMEAKGTLLGNEAERVEVMTACLRAMNQPIEALNRLEEVLKGNLREETALSVWQLYKVYLELAVQQLPASTVWQSLVPSSFAPFSGFSPSEDGLIVCCKVLSNLRTTQQSLTSSSSFARNIRRTGLLAELEFFRLLFSTGKIDLSGETRDSAGPFDAPLLEYLRTYSDIPSAPEDLVPYLSMLTEGQAGRLSEELGSGETQEEPVASVRRQICYAKVRRYLGILSTDPLQAVAWFQTYKTLTTLESPPKKGEHRVADELLLLGCELLRGSSHPLKTPLTLLILTYGVQASPFNFNLKIRLLEEWEGLRFTSAALQLYQELDIKAIQLETLGHLILPSLLRCPHLLPDLQAFCHKVEHFHRTASTDLSDSIQTAYNHFNYEGIRDFWKFKERLMGSKLKAIVELSGVYGRVMEKFQQKIKEIATVMKDSAPILKQILALPDSPISLCDNAVFYSCIPLVPRLPGWPPSPARPPSSQQAFELWSNIHYFKAFTGLLVFTTNFLHPDFELFTQAELDQARTEIDIASTSAEPEEYRFVFGVFVAILKWASSVLVTVKGSARVAAEALEAGREMVAKAREVFVEAQQRLGQAESYADFETRYQQFVHWPLVFGSIIHSAMEALIPEPRKKKGKKLDESQVLHLKLTTLTKEFREGLKALQQAALSALQALQGRDTLQIPLREAFTLMESLANVPEFLSELQAKCSKEQSQPLAHLSDWLQAFPLPRLLDS